MKFDGQNGQLWSQRRRAAAGDLAGLFFLLGAADMKHDTIVLVGLLALAIFIGIIAALGGMFGIGMPEALILLSIILAVGLRISRRPPRVR